MTGLEKLLGMVDAGNFLEVNDLRKPLEKFLKTARQLYREEKAQEARKTVEPLAVLAHKQELEMMIYFPEEKNDHTWAIHLWACEEVERFEGKTYTEAEDKARKFLEAA